MRSRLNPCPDHDCPCGCGARVSHNKLACRAGWFRLPKELRDAVTAHRRGTVHHLLAVADAVGWLKADRLGRIPSTQDGGRPC